MSVLLWCWLLGLVFQAQSGSTNPSKAHEDFEDLESWCNQSAVCGILCPQEGMQCPENQCALHVDGDCCSWVCADQEPLQEAWLEYEDWRVANNFSCPPPLCSPHDFIHNFEFDPDEVQSRSIQTSSVAEIEHTTQLLAMKEQSGTQDHYECTVTVHPVRYAHEMSFKLVDADGEIVCGHARFRNRVQHSVLCSCPSSGDIKVRCKDSYGDGWHGGFLEIADHRGSPSLRFCADFYDGSERNETLPQIDLCDLHTIEAATINIDKYDRNEPNELGEWAGRGTMVLGAVALGLQFFKWGGRGSTADDMFGVMKSASLGHGSRNIFLGLAGSANDVFDKKEGAQVVKEVMSNTIDQVYEDLNQVTDSLFQCVGNTEAVLMQELEDLNQSMVIQMHELDFRTQLNALYLGSQHRLGMALEYVIEFQRSGWVADFVDEGLYTCLDIRSLTSQISAITITEAVRSLALVNDLFTICRLLSILGKELRNLEGVTTPQSRRHIEWFLGLHFNAFYKALKVRGGAAMMRDIGGMIRPFQLRVLNFAQLSVAEYEHAVRNLQFPNRQGGIAEPASRHGYGAVSYSREYSLGNEHKFATTCRFCRKDGGSKVHYGCWEEAALSYDRCVSCGGIFYNSSMDVSNVYSCQQFQSFGHYKRGIGVACGGRPTQ